MIEYREGRRSPYRVRRRNGALTASFALKAAAELQDALWGRWGGQIPVLADKEPRITTALQARLFNKGARELPSTLLAQLLAAHQARHDGTVILADSDGQLLRV